MTVTWWDGAAWVVYPVVWCEHCQADRPHHGPYCCSCGTDTEETAP
jgi:ribosomal protein S12 methylthiotransferase accessory factor YcaO